MLPVMNCNVVAKLKSNGGCGDLQIKINDEFTVQWWHIIWKFSNFCKVVNRHYLKIWHWVSTVMVGGIISIWYLLLQWECKKFFERCNFSLLKVKLIFFFNTSWNQTTMSEWKGREEEKIKIGILAWYIYHYYYLSTNH